MPLIRIKRESIKPNPTAGQDTFHVAGPTKLTFEFNGPFITEQFAKENNLYLAEWEYFSETHTVTRGSVIGKPDIEKLLKLREMGFSFEANRDVQIIFSETPDPDYLYEYENPELTCNECGGQTRLSDIEKEEYDGFYAEQCPKCYTMHSFGPIEYEKIQDVVKELN